MTKSKGILSSIPHHWSLEQRLFNRTAPPNERGCILWIGPSLRSGYGKMGWRGHERLSHRVAWELARGPIPPNMQVCHKCDVPACVNVEHLFLGTFSENMADKMFKGRQAKGRAVAGAKLADAEVLAIRDSARPQNVEAEIYGVDPSTISLIRSRKRWAHLSKERV